MGVERVVAVLLEVLDELLALGRHADGFRVHADHALHGRPPRPLGVGHDGRDLRQFVVLLLGQARIRGEDDVGLRLEHLRVGHAVGLVEERRGLGAEGRELLLDPGHHAVAVVVAPRRLRHPHGGDAEGERDFVIRPGHRRDPSRLGRDRRGAVGVFDLHGIGGVAARRIAGRRGFADFGLGGRLSARGLAGCGARGLGGGRCRRRRVAGGTGGQAHGGDGRRGQRCTDCTQGAPFGALLGERV